MTVHTTPPVTWRPTSSQRAKSRLTAFVDEILGCDANQSIQYRDVWRWSVDEPDAFWRGIWEHFGVIADGFDGRVLVDRPMPSAEWFPSARLNYAENVLRHASEPGAAERIAIVGLDEEGGRKEISWAELAARVGALADSLRDLGVMPGDRVAACMPNVPETVIALLATASVGAIWAVSSPDLSAPGTLGRLRQLEPSVLIGVDGYVFGGRRFERAAHLQAVRAGLPSVRHTIVLSCLGAQAPAGTWDFDVLANPANRTADQPLRFERVPFSAPLWVLFSSGTTGDPKGIVHSHGGIVLEAWKNHALQHDMGPTDKYYVSANTSWMVWNLLVNALIVGAGIVTYSGSPTYGRPDRQLVIVAEEEVTVYGVGAAYLTLVRKSGARPADALDFSELRAVQSTGSPLPEATWRWVHEAIKSEVHLGSDSGGTEICSGFIGSNPWDPVYLGELQGPSLAVAVEAWTQNGEKVVGSLGEMVITRPMPSMPVSFWHDPDGRRYRDSYFETYPGVWHHGDWISETDRGTFVIHGRSDATLNRGGIRLGTAEIYAAVETVPQIAGSLVVGVELPEGEYHLPLFVVPADGVTFDESLHQKIVEAIRSRASARHVPDEIVVVPAIPLSHAGKKMEVPVKRLLSGLIAAKDLNRSVLANPESIDWFVNYASKLRATPGNDA